MNKKQAASIQVKVTDADREDSEDEDEGSEEDEKMETEEVESPQTPATPVKEPQTERRPKKKRKTSVQPEVDVVDMSDIEETQQDFIMNTPPPPPLASLPIFPLPALPNAPSKSELALQGLDKALVDAEIVDSTSTTPISLVEDDDLGISSRTRRRLHELGIAEAFAGTQILLILASILTNTFYSPAESYTIPFALKPCAKIVVYALQPTKRRLRLCADRKWQNFGLCNPHN